ncbi:MAG: hypothetical protein GC154_19860 [bacterium]|nr:hypothetical protein [bacterium]
MEANGKTYFHVIDMNPSSEALECIYCGQASKGALGSCEMCQQQELGVVLALVRRLLLIEGQAQANQKEEQEPEEGPVKVREMLVTAVLDRFPIELAGHIRKFPPLLKKPGVWFAHLCAYCNARYLHWAPGKMAYDMLSTPTYQIVRDQVFHLLKYDGPELDGDAADLLDGVFRIPAANLEPRGVIYQMILSLEERKLLEIDRPKIACKNCGAETPIGSDLCVECRKDEKISLYHAMNSAAPPPLIAPMDAGKKRSGMHARKPVDS